MGHKDRYLERLHQVPMFQGLNQKQLGVVGRQAEDLRYDAGHVVIRQGEPGDEFFLLISGKVSVSVDGKEVATLGPGDFFGELALFDPAPRDATVTTTEPCEVLVIDGRRFAPLLEDVPLLARKITAGLARRLREADSSRAWQ